jgi:hypothetical protein
MNRFVPNEFELPSEPATAKSPLASAADVIDGNMPSELQDLGERIRVNLKKVDNYYDTIGYLLAKAEALCDADGFEEFQDKFCPHFAELGPSRRAELLAIGRGKKSIEDQRAETAKRVRQHRARKKAAANGAEVGNGVDSVTGSPTDPTGPTDPAVIDAVSALVNRPYCYPKAKATAMIEAAARTAGDGADVATLVKLALKGQAKPSPDIPVEQDRADPPELTPEEKSAKAFQAFVDGFEAICEWLPDMSDDDREQALTFVAEELNILDKGE